MEGVVAVTNRLSFSPKQNVNTNPSGNGRVVARRAPYSRETVNVEPRARAQRTHGVAATRPAEFTWRSQPSPLRNRSITQSVTVRSAGMSPLNPPRLRGLRQSRLRER